MGVIKLFSQTLCSPVMKAVIETQVGKGGKD